MNGMLHRFTFKENSYDQMDHPPGMRIGTDRMRHRRHWQDFRIVVGHGFYFGLGLRYHFIAEQLGRIRRLQFRRKWNIIDQPERHIQLIDQPKRHVHGFVRHVDGHRRIEQRHDWNDFRQQLDNRHRLYGHWFKHQQRHDEVSMIAWS